MKKPAGSFRSICFSESSHLFCHPRDGDPATRSTLLATYHQELEKCSPQETWDGDLHLSSTPYPILGHVAHQRQAAQLSEALVLAITDIVQRWWSDADAHFPERMPINPMEEKLLQWMEGLGADVLPPYRHRQGSWRPDFLLESSDDPGQIENFRICEINARFFSNGFLLTAFGQRALSSMGLEKNGLWGAATPEKVINGLIKLVDTSLPLHVVKGEEYGYDIHMWVPYLRKNLNMDVTVIPPENLRLVPAKAPGGYRLYCLSSADSKQPQITNDACECLEEIHQLGIELHQRELHAMSYEMLQQISIRCFNDFRTVFLVHDKRMLGLVLEELDTLVSRSVISSQQAEVLDKGIVYTYVPGSIRLENFISACQEDSLFKDQHLLKPIRSGKGKGILFGDQVSQEDWLSILQDMRNPYIKEGKTTYVVQKLVEQRRYEVLLCEEADVEELPLVGTLNIINGVFLGLGIWRSGPGRLCALSRGGSWVCTVIQK